MQRAGKPHAQEISKLSTSPDSLYVVVLSPGIPAGSSKLLIPAACSSVRTDTMSS